VGNLLLTTGNGKLAVKAPNESDISPGDYHISELLMDFLFLTTHKPICGE
jgi:hypothetical protein